jgi:hypothetical protein
MYATREFILLRRKVATDVMDEFPSLGNRTTARILFQKHPELFLGIENARTLVRFLRGKTGAKNKLMLKEKKYVRD